jgi:mannose-6-phosphate isomerase-like protein (cupin superfamily)
MSLPIVPLPFLWQPNPGDQGRPAWRRRRFSQFVRRVAKVTQLDLYYLWRSHYSGRQANIVFQHTNLFDLPLKPGGSHGGKGTQNWASVASSDQVRGALHFIMYTELAPQSSIGAHPHAINSEEYYLILSGSGQMRLDDDIFNVTAGELVRNEPGATHDLTNTGEETLRLFVFNAETRSD